MKSQQVYIGRYSPATPAKLANHILVPKQHFENGIEKFNILFRQYVL